MTEPERKAGISAVVVDASFGTRHLDNTRSSPKSLKNVKSGGTVLDYLAAIKNL